MKFNLIRFVVLAMVALVLGSVTYAQTVNVHAQVPFSFVLGDKVYPAGEYAIQSLVDYSYSLRVSNRKAKVTSLAESYPVSFVNEPRQTALIFTRIGNTYFLYQVRTEDSSVGRQFRPGRIQTQMAMNTTTSGTVVVAANLVH